MALLVSSLAGPLSWASHARADAASGTYTGNLSLRGNYYWEKSTRVVSPAASATLETPSGVRVDGTYLLDAITSASTSSGVNSDNSFTERRNDAQAGVGYEFDLGKSQLDISARGRFSKEPDYFSRGGGLNAALSLDERNTILRFTSYAQRDDVYRKVRMNTTADPAHLTASQAISVGELNVLSLGVAWDQLINRTTTLTVGYDLGLLDGFQANAYRMVPFQNGGGAGAERHPNKRARNAPYLWLAHFFNSTRTAIRAGYRLYYDSWNILAHTPEVRLHQEIGRYLELRTRYRYYTQDASFFFRKGGNLNTDKYITMDPKMTAFHNQTLGFKVQLSLEFLAFSKFHALHGALLDWNVEYVFNTNRYGNGVIAQGGLGFPF